MPTVSESASPAIIIIIISSGLGRRRDYFFIFAIGIFTYSHYYSREVCSSSFSMPHKSLGCAKAASLAVHSLALFVLFHVTTRKRILGWDDVAHWLLRGPGHSL